METLKVIVIALVVGGVVAGTLIATKTDAPVVVERLGGAAQNFQNIGGVQVITSRSTSFTQATNTVVCALQSPPATSSLMLATAELSMNDATTSGSSLSLSYQANSSLPGVIGTVLSSTTIASGARANVTAASSTIFAPNSYLIVGHRPSTGNVSDTGACQAVWAIHN